MTSSVVCERILSCGISGRILTPEDIAELPVFTGSYVLALRMGRAPAIELPPKLSASVDPGWYVYAGSAHGSGGVRSRLKRHFRRHKTIHWHIDRLTVVAQEMVAVAVPGGNECDLVGRMTAEGKFSVAIRAFGSSDCRECESHLLRPV